MPAQEMPAIPPRLSAAMPPNSCEGFLCFLTLRLLFRGAACSLLAPCAIGKKSVSVWPDSSVVSRLRPASQFAKN
jgi:hypothetical protein